MAYFLIAVSNRTNLDLCLKHALAGFTSSASGLWAYLDIRERDYISFLYGARAFNLYEVRDKRAYAKAESLPPWPPVTFRPSGLTYYFPFRLELNPIRTLEEPLVRAEFAYVAENLLLRGGYRKTHFQADQTTLQAVSEMGRPFVGGVEKLSLGGGYTMTPLLTTNKSHVQASEVFLFRELFLQALARSYLSSEDNLAAFLELAQVHNLEASTLEVLGEKAFPEGHVDLLIKEAAPKGISRKVVVEVKRGPATGRDVLQLSAYMQTLAGECVGGVLVAGSVPPRIRARAEAQGISVLCYSLNFPEEAAPFEDLAASFSIVSG